MRHRCWHPTDRWERSGRAL